MASGDVEGLGTRAAHPQPVELHAGQARVVVDEGDRPVRAVGAVQQRARDLAAGVTGSEHDERLGLVVGRGRR